MHGTALAFHLNVLEPGLSNAAASAACNPIDDKRGTIAYRKQVAGVLAKRAVLLAAERAAERNGDAK